LKASLGADLTADLAKAAPLQLGDPIFRFMLPCADVVWMGLRVADLDGGDRVVAVEGRACAPKLDEQFWKPVEITNGALKVWDRTSDAPRDGTQRVIRIGEKRVVLVSPVERDSVDRVLRDGPDPLHADPSAEGVVSLDLHPHGFAPSLAHRFPSLANVVRGITRVKANATMADDGLLVVAEIQCRNKANADHVARFFGALRDVAPEVKGGALLGNLVVDQVETTLRLKWRVPAPALRALLTDAVAPDATSSQ
jgi:hypothetical protein